MDTKTTAKGMRTCSVCNRDFALIVEEHYVAREPGRTGLSAIAGGEEPKLWDAFDCPYCGCQNRVHPRARMVDDCGRDLPWFGCGECDEEEDKE